jgi:DNA-binding IclR family transcriptional regulator
MGEDRQGSTTGAPLSSTGNTVERAFAVLEHVVASETALGVRELGRRVGLPRSTAARLIGMLEGIEMVARTGDGKVRPGPGLARLAPSAGRPAPELSEVMRPILEQLVVAHGESAALSFDDGDRVLYVEEIGSDGPIQVPVNSGRLFPFHLVASGLVLMAAWEDDRIAEYCSRPLESATEHSMTDPAQLKRRIDYVRRRGYAWTDQELDLEVNGLAVPVLEDGVAVAALSMYGPAYRFGESLPGSMLTVDALRSAAEHATDSRTG